MRADLLRGAAVVPRMRTPIAEPRDVKLLRLRVGGLDAAALDASDLDGVNQHADGDTIEIRDPRDLEPGAPDAAAARYLAAEPFVEKDAPEIRAEAEKAIAGARTARDRAERLTRYVNALLDKKPTVSLPSAREVLRTKVGDCNEHTALYVAMARAAGIPARIAVGLVLVHGAFYYHAWPEVYADAMWLPVDPTLNQFPADATHLRLARGGLDKQAAILPLIGRLTITVVDVELAPNSTPVLVGRTPPDLGTIAVPVPARGSSCCRCDR
jgi:transglutaminase-like putative cysteine protease